jgi:hypothetical protein
MAAVAAVTAAAGAAAAITVGAVVAAMRPAEAVPVIRQHQQRQHPVRQRLIRQMDGSLASAWGGALSKTGVLGS